MTTCKGCLDNLLAAQQTKEIPKTPATPPITTPTDPPVEKQRESGKN